MSGIEQSARPGELRHTLHTPMGLVRVLGVLILGIPLMGFYAIIAHPPKRGADLAFLLGLCFFMLAWSAVLFLVSTKFRPTVRVYDNGIEHSVLKKRFIPFGQVQTAYSYHLAVHAQGAGVAGALAGAAVSGARHVFWTRENGAFKKLELDKSYAKKEIENAVRTAFDSAAARAIAAVQSGARYESPLGPWISAKEASCFEPGFFSGKPTTIAIDRVASIEGNEILTKDGKKLALPAIDLDWVLIRVYESLGVRVAPPTHMQTIRPPKAAP